MMTRPYPPAGADMTDPVPFPSFSGHTTACPKCGAVVGGCRYVPAGADGSPSWAHGTNLDYPHFRAHLSRSCGCCGHAWLERPLDEPT